MVYELLRIGKENAASADYLTKLLDTIEGEMFTEEWGGIPAIVEDERREGMPICDIIYNGKPMYYIPRDQKEMSDYCGRLFHRAGEIFQTLAMCLETAEKLPGKAEEG